MTTRTESIGNVQLPVSTAVPNVRRISFPFGRRTPLYKYFVEGDMAHSHFIAFISGVFPAGEEFFIRSVRAFSDEIIDQGLRERVAGFIGQEAKHGNQHRELNRKLIDLGYLIGYFDPGDQLLGRIIAVESRVPGYIRLAATAAFEHYTAVLAERVLESPWVQQVPHDPEVINLLNWHALEELEHKSVAFDVYRAVGGPEWLRIVTMAVILAITGPVVTLALFVGMLVDPYARRHPIAFARQTWALNRSPLLRGLFGKSALYLRPGFHPDDIDTGPLLAQWQEELFGAHGTLNDITKNSRTSGSL
ncbi:metal-dependent hydrolase [Mycobacterium sp. CBMA271]|uniref:metal-dependent hydrolase n=1 Tax=unclassified Mycobacteroides TaxID=2618759 RepID=UPI0012DDA3D4|nr:MULTISPECIES: metal-dependent hydrolase [unclassified Mycobacteroides]MUM17862.1 metal-dependent hydrolase [Mycobacteroides sp. CBMA 326]MUM20433.1 metal-dependent hydrolase [Mycobacteroides sp. CBMA 271]